MIFELLFALERRVAYLESQLRIARQQPLTMQELYERRQEKLDYYRQQYEGSQDVREDAQDEIDSGKVINRRSRTF